MIRSAPIRGLALTLAALLITATLPTAGAAAGITISTTVDNGFVTTFNGITVATWSDGGVPTEYFWADDGKGTPLGSGRGNGIVEATEIRTLALPHPAGIAYPVPSGILVVNNRLTISFTYLINTGDTERDIWIDDNADLEVGSTEIHRQPISMAPATFETLTLFGGFRASAHGAMKVWIDDGRGGGIPNDGVVNGSEDRNVFTVSPVGGTLQEGISCKALATIRGHLAVFYTYFKYIDEGAGASRTETQLYLWVDDGNGGGVSNNQQAEGSEIRTLELLVRDDVNFIGAGGTATLFELNGHAAIAYARVNNVIGSSANNYKASIWIDDGRGGGTADDLAQSGGEIRDIEITQAESAIQAGLPYNGKAAVAYVSEGNGTGGKVKFWVDDGRGGGTASDGVVNGTEVQTLDGPTVDFHGQAIVSGPKLLTLYYHKTQGALKLWTVDVPPAVTSINPTSGFGLGDTLVTITGRNFFPTSSVTFGGVAATELTYINDTSMTVRTPEHAVGVADVVVTNSDGLTGTLAAAFTYQPNPSPQLTSVSPTSGAVFGGTLMTVTGNYFQTGAVVLVGGHSLLNMTRVNSRTITGTVPQGAEGPADVTLQNPDAGTATLASGYTYTLGTTITEVEKSKFFPSPFRPKNGNNAMIVNAPDGSTIRIFDVNCHMVKELHTVGNGVLWDVRNESGEDLASGIYLYLVTDPSGNKFKNRFMVIR